MPCPQFSIAERRLGADDKRGLFPQALRLVEECEPAAVMPQNVRGLASARFASYREHVVARLERLGYQIHWQVLNAWEYGVPQPRPRSMPLSGTVVGEDPEAKDPSGLGRRPKR